VKTRKKGEAVAKNKHRKRAATGSSRVRGARKEGKGPVARFETSSGPGKTAALMPAEKRKERGADPSGSSAMPGSKLCGFVGKGESSAIFLNLVCQTPARIAGRKSRKTNEITLHLGRAQAEKRGSWGTAGQDLWRKGGGDAVEEKGNAVGRQSLVESLGRKRREIKGPRWKKRVCGVGV